MKENYAQFTSTSLSLITLAANQFLMSIKFVNNSHEHKLDGKIRE